MHAAAAANLQATRWRTSLSYSSFAVQTTFAHPSIKGRMRLLIEQPKLAISMPHTGKAVQTGLRTSIDASRRHFIRNVRFDALSLSFESCTSVASESRGRQVGLKI
jgi:hypothetical protein